MTSPDVRKQEKIPQLLNAWKREDSERRFAQTASPIRLLRLQLNLRENADLQATGLNKGKESNRLVAAKR
jgi:hypothetical protein